MYESSPEKFILIKPEELKAMMGKMKEDVLEELRSDISPEYLSAKDVEKTLSVSHGTVWNWTKRGILHPVKIEGRVLYEKWEMLKILNERKI
ncbi:MAG TPA: hypothetical protein DCS83_06370 [Prevotella sp.]|jgi:hypothetical protein|nr:helix-turn-helix domain-containing protein [uncultured Prevotella sp.]MCH4241657.1 helix-turn-helix domain-containing protein [Prevotella sp.]HAT62158.1 hypothetical protein [Prevotella sp.]